MSAEWDAAGLEALAFLQGHTYAINDGPIVRYEAPSIWDEPYLPIAERETIEPVPASGCPTACLYGECRAPGSSMGCGGCCGCLRGCQVVFEQGYSAPLVWTGDSA